jgi:hypothetical protein
MLAQQIDGERTIRGFGQVFRIYVRGRSSEQRVAMAVDGLAVLITAERHRDKLEKPDEASPLSTIAC